MKKNIFRFFRSFLDNKKKIDNPVSPLTSHQVILLKYRLEKYMYERRPFLRAGYSIRDMAFDLGLHSYQLSAFINHEIGMHFTDYINRFRIEYCKMIIRTDMTGKISLKELAFKCGFNNRNSFTSAFKKFTGLKPSDYIKPL